MVYECIMLYLYHIIHFKCLYKLIQLCLLTHLAEEDTYSVVWHPEWVVAAFLHTLLLKKKKGSIMYLLAMVTTHNMKRIKSTESIALVTKKGFSHLID